jgi:hypothetical protein
MWRAVWTWLDFSYEHIYAPIRLWFRRRQLEREGRSES